MNTSTTAPDQSGSAEGKNRESFSLIVLDEHFNEQSVTLVGPKPTGRQIAEAAGQRPADDAIILQWLEDGTLEELRLEELADLREGRRERFFVIEGDRTFRLMIDGLRIEWPRQKVTGETIRRLVGRDESYDVFQDFDDAPDAKVEEDEVVPLGGKGLERFKTKHSKKLVTVYYNDDQRFELERRVYTAEELREIFAVEAGYVLAEVAEDGEFKELKPGGKIPVREGMRFVSYAPTGQSS
jgi:hypothetical protein